MTGEMHARVAERGEALDDGLLVHSCRQRAVSARWARPDLVIR
jgi:hypothetical protein